MSPLVVTYTLAGLLGVLSGLFVVVLAALAFVVVAFVRLNRRLTINPPASNAPRK